MPQKDGLEIYKVNQIYADCSVWKSLVVVTAWSNGEGYDISLTSMNGCIQTIAITYGEFELVKKMIEKLENL